jgi:hypothetical protein
MDDQLQDELRRILRAIVIHSSSEFSFAGQPHKAGEIAFPATAQAFMPTHPLVAALEMVLYENCYCRRFGAVPTPLPVSFQADDLLPALRAANATADRWEADWEVLHVFPAGQLIARRHGVHRTIAPGDFITANGAGWPNPGATIHLFCRRELLNSQPGFYFAMGGTLADQQDESCQLRFYWHASAESAPDLLALITRALNRFEIPFRCKCLTTSAAFRRADSTVLYLNRRHSHIALQLLATVHERIAARLGDETPFFARRLARGMAIAEDPGNGESFGMHRCRLFAEAIWNAFERRSQHEAERLAAIEEHFRQAGLNLAAAHLNAGSSDTYTWPNH